MRTLHLFLLERALLLMQLLGALMLETGVVTGIKLRLALVQVQRMRGHAIEEFTIVRNQQQGARIFQQPLLQPQHGIQIQMVGRLVQQQQIRRRHQCACEIQSHPPATGECRHCALLGIGREAKPVQQTPGACAGVVPVQFLQPVMRFGDRFPILGGDRRQLGLDRGIHRQIAR